MDHVMGQPAAVSQLQRQAAAGRVHHAYIFHGPPGVGKFTTALAFAQLILCQDPHPSPAPAPGSGPRACGRCRSCELIARGGHTDLHVVNKELARFSEDRAIRERKLTTIPVEVLRDALLEPVYRKAAEGHGKVFIVDEAELLNPAGQNLLLKTLEEPPAGTHIILVTSSEDRLLPTIRSRCQRTAFVPLTDDLVLAQLPAMIARHAAAAPGLIADAERNLAKITERESARGGDAKPAKGKKESPKDRALAALQKAKAHAAWLDRAAKEPRLRAWLAEFGAGALGRVDLALRHDLAEWALAVLPALDAIRGGRADPELGATLYRFIDQFAEMVVAADDQASKVAANKLAAALMSTMITQHARKKLRELAEHQADEPVDLDDAARPWLTVIDVMHEAEGDLASNVQMSLVCDHLVSQLQRGMAA